ncbi:MAG: SMC-Scp complex subunit ScpB [Bacteroidota bacterium]
MKHLEQHIESLIFSSSQPISLEEIKKCLEAVFEAKIVETDLLAAMEQLEKRYEKGQYSFEIVALSGGYQFLTKGAYHETVSTYLRQTTNRKLSKSALETLSIVAYKQPVPKSELEKIRGVACDYALQKLLEKELVVIKGRSDSPGRPLLYGTSERFMNYFGINSIKDLPKLKDFKQADSEIGERAP